MTILDYLRERKVHVHNVSGNEAHCNCPLHDDKKISFSINVNTGLWKCFGECSRGGNLAQLHSLRYDTPIAQAIKDIEELGVLIENAKEKVQGNKVEQGETVDAKEVEGTVIDGWHGELLKREDIIGWLRDKRGITLQSITDNKLGYEASTQRITIPIQVGGKYVNVRKYDYLHKDNAKMVSYGPGYGTLSLFPLDRLDKQKPIILFEGETDCLLGISLGLNGLTVTGGAGSWKKGFNKHIKGQDVFICYDIDQAGKDGAIKVRQELTGIAKGIKIIQLDITEPSDGDFTDYIVKHNKTLDDFNRLCGDAENTGSLSQSPSERSDISITLHESGDKKYYFKRVSFNAIISGKDLAPFICPKRVELTCRHSLKRCGGCPAKTPDGKVYVNFTEQDRDLLSLIGTDEIAQKVIYKKISGINCTLMDCKSIEVMNVEQVRIVPEIEYSSQDKEYVTRQAFTISHGVRTNREYQMKGVVVPHPNTQYATIVIDEMEPKQSSLDKFQLTAQDKKNLVIFQDDGNIGVKLDDIYKDLSHNVTHIYNRDDITLAADLVFHSVLNFVFMGKLLKKGWTECLILGDTRCGKSEMISGIIQHYRAGELCTGENTSYAGLIGGMQQAQKTWSISWGKIPLNDRRLVALDEASGLLPEDIANMSGVRSSGIAEVVKIQTERTHSRTRLIWLSNPRSGRRLDTYNQGVLAVKELIGKVEDIARFDFAITSASGEVNVDEIYKNKIEKVKHVYTSDLCHKLVMWAWSRNESQIAFHDEAIKRILECSEKFGKTYSSTIPLVERAEQRIKIARLSVAVAARLFSTDDGERIIVYPRHVDFVSSFLEKCYTKPSMAYDMYSAAVKKTEEVGEDEVKVLEKQFFKFPNFTEVRDLLLEYQVFRKSEIVEQLGYGLEDTRELFKWLGKNRLIKSTPIGYVKSPGFTAFLKRQLNIKPDIFEEAKDNEF